jgi:carbamoyl-phosphate synthase large subunit
VDDVAPSWRKKVLVLGSGATASGRRSSSTGAASTPSRRRQELGYETILLNYNPETVSTDYDVCDKLVFDEISFETVLDLYEREQPYGVVVSMGGQVPNNLAHQAAPRGREDPRHQPEPTSTARRTAEKFSDLLDELEIDQPKWAHHHGREPRTSPASPITWAASRCWCGRRTCSRARR